MPLVFDDIEKVPNGAHFYSADLHVHSFGASHDVRDPKHTVEGIIISAALNDITILAITDHNTAQNVDTALAYAADNFPNLLVLPAVEITTAHGHLLVYFAPEASARVRDLLAVIKIQGAPGSQDSHTAMSMASVIKEAENLGGICIAAHIDAAKTGFEALADGYPAWKHDILNSSGLYGIEIRDEAHLSWYSSSDEATAAGRERKNLLREREQVASLAGRASLAALQNSDAHSLADFEAQHAKRQLTRLKMDELTFEGFRTALIDPTARVRAGGAIPATFPRILGMHLEGGFLDGTTIHFSDNLNCFIGGRGTGKSTALQSLAYGLGLNDDFEQHDNCPDTVTIYCDDADGVRYRYERVKGFSTAVQAKEDRSIVDVPADAFRVEFYSQGHLAEVARDPLGNPALLQAFLDSHLILDDLSARETEVLSALAQNSSQLIPLEASANQLTAKEQALAALDKKLQIAEAGRLSEVAVLQGRLQAEKALVQSLREVSDIYAHGLSLAGVRRDYSSLAQSVGAISDDATTRQLFAAAKGQIDEANSFLGAKEKELTAGLAMIGARLKTILRDLGIRHSKMTQDITSKIADFQKQGLSGDLRGLQILIAQRARVVSEIAVIRRQEQELQSLRAARTSLLGQLRAVRGERASRRKEQLAPLNRHLHHVIDHYSVNLFYDPIGMVDDFKRFILEMMHGTYYQEETASALCSATDPASLAQLIRANDVSGLSRICGTNWTRYFMERGADLTTLHKLEVMDKPLKPVIKVRTKGTPAQIVPVTQLSDGQRHTILLTIAMLADSNVPLIIDQPEDDLDNAFIFSSVVQTLRSIKEKRQVVVVTHNANIAVLGDSEMIFPMVRADYKGTIQESGSIDRDGTKAVVQKILEGGEVAFRKRKEIYGYAS